MKKLKWLIVTVLFLIVFQCTNVFAAESEKYQIGENVWCYLHKKTGSEIYDTLIIEGAGKTYDYTDKGFNLSGIKKPEILNYFNSNDGKIYPKYNLYISEGVVELGDFLLFDVDIQNIVFPKYSFTTIGEYNFRFEKLKLQYENVPKTISKIEMGNDLYFICGEKILALPTEIFNGDAYKHFDTKYITINDKTKIIQGHMIGNVDLCICVVPKSVTKISPFAFTRNAIIRGYIGSYAERYAKAYHYKFESIGSYKPEIGKTYDVGDFRYKVTSKNTIQLYKVLKKTTKVSIPNYIKIGNTKFNVTSIAPKAFYKNTTITSLSIGKNITSIGSYAFYGCSKLTCILVPANVQKINSSAFKAMKSVRFIKVYGTKLSAVGKYAFYPNKTAKIYVPKEKYTVYKKLIDKSRINKGQKYVRY